MEKSKKKPKEAGTLLLLNQGNFPWELILKNGAKEPSRICARDLE